MSEKLLLQVIDRLTAIETRIDNMSGTMATKDDLAKMATKDDLAKMATKEELAKMATKDDLAALSSKFDVLSSDFARMESKLDSTIEQVVLNTEFEATVLELAATVEQNTTDIKLIKKLVANF